LKIVHLNTYENNGGAGRACSRLHEALVQQGVDSNVWVNFSFEKESKVNNFSAGLLPKGITAGGILLERLTSKMLLKPLKTPFTIPVWGRDISRHPAIHEADILHLHWINHGFLRPRDLEQLKRLKKPIVWTFHDSNAFTGGCHVRYGCDHFEQECGNCPLLKDSNPNDWSHRIWNQKAAAYPKLNIHPIAPSGWMADSVLRSKLMADRPVQVIPNTLNTSIFKPGDKAAAKAKLGIDPQKLVLLSGFMPSKNDLHKGTPYLLEALELLAKTTDTSNLELVVFGNRNTNDLPDFPISVRFLGTIGKEQELASCYQAADGFLAPSLEDNLPYTVMESLSCGTPVIAFTTGGIPDMVKHQENGYLATYKSAKDFAAGIAWLLAHTDRELLNTAARKTVEERFSEAVVAKQHIELYQRLL